jgi:hypothetical protein
MLGELFPRLLILCKRIPREKLLVAGLTPGDLAGMVAQRLLTIGHRQRVDPSKMEAYLAQTARNVLITHSHREFRRRMRLLDENAPLHELATHINPANQASARMQLADIRKRLSTMPREKAIAILMRMEGESFDAIGHALRKFPRKASAQTHGFREYTRGIQILEGERNITGRKIRGRKRK